ncbi:hypothetical protein MPTK1_6g01020 [Marchantia polymorpha subsp. ruderalis]|uniref:Uncharacterized protein n=2 Tax=Marchantia polymorpha TaxID=3197 RepID=A0AAF6BM91_MARPO|nr:hypothetical protein MARPO_0052s0102 [Marchantia polymorpha]BBN13125.1 hypothetical protein Mp_6g01020 [Marchantia polymorpha subsp. ruderalis]|eukprot:PTQ38323.1 hypothetical protein MARPO_0052s0102 [Marchantia polymorpha]
MLTSSVAVLPPALSSFPLHSRARTRPLVPKFPREKFPRALGKRLPSAGPIQSGHSGRTYRIGPLPGLMTLIDRLAGRILLTSVFYQECAQLPARNQPPPPPSPSLPSPLSSLLSAPTVAGWLATLLTSPQQPFPCLPACLPSSSLLLPSFLRPPGSGLKHLGERDDSGGQQQAAAETKAIVLQSLSSCWISLLLPSPARATPSSRRYTLRPQPALPVSPLPLLSSSSPSSSPSSPVPLPTLHPQISTSNQKFSSPRPIPSSQLPAPSSSEQQQREKRGTGELRSATLRSYAGTNNSSAGSFADLSAPPTPFPPPSRGHQEQQARPACLPAIKRARPTEREPWRERGPGGERTNEAQERDRWSKTRGERATIVLHRPPFARSTSPAGQRRRLPCPRLHPGTCDRSISHPTPSCQIRTFDSVTTTSTTLASHHMPGR